MEKTPFPTTLDELETYPQQTLTAEQVAQFLDCRAADKAGLSYGQYMLQKNKKPAGVGAPTSCKG